MSLVGKFFFHCGKEYCQSGEVVEQVLVDSVGEFPLRVRQVQLPRIDDHAATSSSREPSSSRTTSTCWSKASISRSS